MDCAHSADRHPRTTHRNGASGSSDLNPTFPLRQSNQRLEILESHQRGEPSPNPLPQHLGLLANNVVAETNFYPPAFFKPDELEAEDLLRPVRLRHTNLAGDRVMNDIAIGWAISMPRFSTFGGRTGSVVRLVAAVIFAAQS